MKKSNRELNKKRNEENELGRKALGKGKAAVPTVSVEVPEMQTATAEPQEGVPQLRKVISPYAKRKRGDDESAKTDETAGESIRTPKRARRSVPNRTDDDVCGSDLHVDNNSHNQEDIAANKKRASRQICGKHAGQCGLEATSSSGIMSKPTEPAKTTVQWGSEDELYYKVIICDLLGVGREWSGKLELRLLRLYAGAYNDAYPGSCWVPSDQAASPNFYCDGHRLFRPNSSQRGAVHFDQGNIYLQGLAIARGDLTDTGAETLGKNMRFNTGGDWKLETALGMQDNPFGPAPVVYLPKEALPKDLAIKME